MNIEDRLYTLSEYSSTQLPKPISAIVTNSQKVIPNSVFVALKGYKTDGHYHLQEAVQKGAQVLIIENKKYLENLNFKGMVCVTQNSKQLLPLLLNEFYDFPSHKMFCAGITGTNGKTTVSHILSFILSYCGWKAGLIGTIKQGFLKTKSAIQKNIIQAPTNINPEHLTTPNIVNLYALLDHFYKKDAQAVVMEASSIGLDQNRTGGIDFNLAIWTNLTTDHLDYHQNMESYFQSKKILFTNQNIQNNHCLSIINFDDPYGLKLVRDLKTPYISYGQKNANFTWKIISSDLSGTTFQLLHDSKQRDLHLSIPGVYNVPNAVAAIAAATAAGFSMEKISEALPLFPGVRGRMERIQSNKHCHVFIDYAHTPDALTTTLSFLKQHKKSGQLICVFGCGGARDKTKRPLMGAAADQFADTIILTSDNSRTENPEQIIQDILVGIQNKNKVIIEPDRKQAIQKALKNHKNNVILIAGKGHETQQIIGSKRIPFDDRITVESYLQ